MEWRSLPEDLVDEILSRVPAKSLARLRSTSKQWNTLLKSVSFAKRHYANAPKEESLIITLIHSRVCLVRINLGDIDNTVSPSAKVAYHFNLNDPFSNTSQVHIINIFHCDGLLLCTTKDKKLVLWNPCSRDTKWIKPRHKYKESDYYALGYDIKSSGKQFKILRVGRQDILPIKNEYEIYDLTSNSWRVLGVATDWFLAKHRRGISVKGIIYWVATQATSRSNDDFLLSFDFSTEMFQSLSLPHPFPCSISALSVVREEQLCLLGTDHKFWIVGNHVRKDFHVWVATSTGSDMSWSKLLEVKGYKHYKFSVGMSFLADEQNQVVMYLSPNNILNIASENKHTKVDNLVRDSTRISSFSVLLNFVPSLAQIQQDSLPVGRKRKAPST